MSDDAKARMCPCPKTASKRVRTLFEDLVQRSPLGAFSLASREALLAYCKLTIQVAQLSSRPRLNDAATKRMTHLTHALRSLSVRLNLKELETKSLRSEEAVVEQHCDQILARIEADPTHPRHGLLGARVRDLP